MSTQAPLPANTFAVCRPRPPFAPVITAVRPARSGTDSRVKATSLIVHLRPADSQNQCAWREHSALAESFLSVGADPNISKVIQLRMSVADMGRARFAYSPLAEVAESLYMLACGRIQEPHRA